MPLPRSSPSCWPRRRVAGPACATSTTVAPPRSPSSTSARPDLDDDTARQLAAIVQVLGTAAVWQALRDFWDLDGAAAAAAVTTAIDRLLTPGGT